MEDLLNTLDFDPVASPIGIVVILLGIRMLLGAFRTMVKLIFLVVILVGAYLFFFGGQVS